MKLLGFGWFFAFFVVLTTGNMRWSLAAESVPLSSSVKGDAPDSGLTAATVFSTPIKIKSQFRLRSEFREFTDTFGPRNLFLMRHRADLSFGPTQDVLVFVQPQFSKAFGDQINPVVPQAGKQTMQSTSGQLFDPSLTMHQAYVSYRMAPFFEFLGGRQILSYGDEILVGGGLGWHNVGRSFDSLRGIFRYDLGSTELLGSKVVDLDAIGFSNTTGTSTNDSDLFAVYNRWNFGPFFKETDWYWLYFVDKSKPGHSLAFSTAGLRLKSSLKHLDYRAEVDYQAGILQHVATSNNAYQVEVEAGYTVPDVITTRVAWGGTTSSEDFNQLYAAAHKFLGTADVFARRNITAALLKIYHEMGDKWKLQNEVLRLFRTSPRNNVYQIRGFGSEVLGNAKSGSSDLGFELDSSLHYSLSKMVALLGGVSILFPGESLISQFGDSKPLLAFLQMEVKF